MEQWGGVDDGVGWWMAEWVSELMSKTWMLCQAKEEECLDQSVTVVSD